MRKFWGWLLFVFFIFVIRLTQVNLSDGVNDINWFIVAGWWIAGLVALFGWHRLAIHKQSHREVK